MGRRKRNLKYKSTDVIDIDKAREERRKKRLKSDRKQKKEAAAASGAASAQKRKKKKSLRRILVYAAVVLLFAGIIGWKVYDLCALSAEQKEAQKQLEELKEERDALQEELKTVEDPAYIEQKAREDLHMIKPGETLYVLMNKDKAAEENKADEAGNPQKKGTKE